MRRERSPWLRVIEDTAHRFRHVVPFAGHPLRGDASYAPFFIVSSGRAGTTLVRRILTMHPDVFIPPEVSLKPAITLYRRNNRLNWRTLVPLVLSYYQFSRDPLVAEVPLRDLAQRLRKLPKPERNLARILDGFYREQMQFRMGRTDARWGDKTPANVFAMDQILEVFPDARFIHLYRDGCDVVQSFVSREMHPSYEHAAVHWVSSLECVAHFRKRHAGILHELRYEDLARNPEHHIRELCRFIDLDYDDRLLSGTPPDADAIASTYSANDSRLAAAVDAAAIGKGRRELTSETRQILAPIMDLWLARLGYQPCREA